jgi:hypothetical protein
MKLQKKGYYTGMTYEEIINKIKEFDFQEILGFKTATCFLIDRNIAIFYRKGLLSIVKDSQITIIGKNVYIFDFGSVLYEGDINEEQIRRYNKP